MRTQLTTKEAKSQEQWLLLVSGLGSLSPAMDVDIWATGATPGCSDIEYELDTSYPRLDSPFYHRLRNKYPRAFRRRTLNGSMSETSSVYSEVMMSRSQRTMPSPRNQSADGQQKEGRPPRHPGVEKSDAGSADMGIVGMPRPRQRRGLYKGTGSQYSSATSLYSQIVENSHGMLYKSEAMISLRERLLKNQESWDRLLSDDPPRRLKQRGSRTDLSKLGLSLSTESKIDSCGIDCDDSGSNADKLDRLCKLGQALEKLMAGDREVTVMEPLSVNTSMDMSQVTESPSAPDNVGRKACQTNGVRGRQSRSKCRTPKLRSRGASPRLRSEPNSLNSSINGDLTPRSRLFSPDQGIVTSSGSTCSVQNKQCADQNRHSKDSDADSGISQPVVKSLETFSLTDDERNPVYLINSANHEDLNSQKSATRMRKMPKTQIAGTSTNMFSTPRSRSYDKKREVTFEDEAYESHTDRCDTDRRQRSVSQSALYADDNAWISYADVVTGYGVPPGFDIEQYSDYLSNGIHETNGHLRNPAAARSKQAARLEGSHKPRKHASSNHPNSSSSTSSLVPPPRTKHKQQQGQQNGARRSHQQDHPQRSISQSDLQIVPSISELELNNELVNTSLDDIDFDNIDPGKKKSKLPWRKNKGRFTPTKEMERVHNKIGSLSRSSSKTSLVSSAVGDGNVDSVAPFDSAGRRRSDSSMAGSVSGHGRPTDKPPPVPKPKHLSKQNGVSAPRQELESRVNGFGEKPTVAPKPQVKVEKRSAKELAETCSESQKSSDANMEERGGHPERNVAHKSGSQFVDATEQNSRANTHNLGRKSTSRFSGYEDVEDMAYEILPPSENDYETVLACSDMRATMPVDTDGSKTDPDVTEFHEVPVDVPPGCDQYASVDFSKKTHRTQNEEPPVEYINYDNDFLDDHDADDDVNNPPLPERHYHSNLEKTKGLGGSRTSLSGGITSLKNSARKKFSKLRKALSLENVNKTNEESVHSQEPATDSLTKHSTAEPNNNFKRSSSLKSLTDAFGFMKSIRNRRSSGAGSHAGNLAPSQRRPPRPPSGSKKAISNPEAPSNFRPIGNIKAMNEDGTRVIELNKPPHGPFGFYIARASAKYNHGIVISRLSDALPDHFFAGLIAVGDEILEINGREVHDMTLEDVFDIMASENRLILRTVPYASRTEI